MKVADFLKAVQGEVGHGYWYGTYVGQVSSEALLKSKSLQFPKQYLPAYIARSRRWLDNKLTPGGGPGTPVCDCVGLIKGIVWRADHAGAYQADSDLSANGMYGKCALNGPIATLPEKPGIVVWKDGHIGVYAGNGVVVEARGVDVGVIRSNIKDLPWTNWGECHLIDYSAPQVSDMEQRANAAEAKLASLTLTATGLSSQVTALNARVTDLTQQLATEKEDAADLKLALRKVTAWIEL